ncbi:MAG: DMT family transporter [Ramlibacter sp.]
MRAVGGASVEDMHSRPPTRLTEFALLLLLSALWGASYAFIKLGVETIPPVTLIASRTLVAGLLLWALLRWRGVHLPRDHVTWLKFGMQACLNSVLPFTLIAWAEQTVDSSLATMLNALSPVFAYLMGCLLGARETAGPVRFLGVVLGLGGIALIVGATALHGLGDQVLAQLAIVFASVCYGGAALFGRQFNRLDPMLPAAGSLLCGAAVLVPLSLVVDRPWLVAPAGVSLVALGALSVFSTALALVIYFRLLTTLGPLGTTAQAYLRVPVGVAVGVFFMGESLAATAWAGFACVVAGVAAMTITPKNAH